MTMTDPLPEPTIPPGHLFCFGMGYTGRRLARRLIDAGWTVSGTTRTAEKMAALEAEGIRPVLFPPEAPIAKARAVLDGVTHVIGSIPPTDAGDPALIHHAEDLKALPTLTWAAYLSTPAVYGDRGGALVDEDAEPAPGSPRGARRLAAERAWVAAFEGTPVSVGVFRLSGIYGPGRTVLDQVRAGTGRIIDKPGQVFNRIHVDDIGSILLASMARPNPGRIYNVADLEAANPGDPIRFAATLLGVDPPTPIPYDSAELSPMARSFYSECKRLVTTRLSEELGVALTYPTYREGLRAIHEGRSV